MANEIKKLNNRHYKMIDLCLRGFKNVQIAEQLQMTPSAVALIINSGLFQHELSIRRSQLAATSNEHIANVDDEVDKTLREGALKAANRLVLNTQCGVPSAENAASEAILDRTGFSRVTKQENKSVGVQLIITPELASVIKSTLSMEQ